MDNAPLPGKAAGTGMSKSRLKASLHLLGSALACLGVLFVADRLYKYTGQVNLARFDALDWGLAAGLACVYGAANVFLACAWQHLLAFFHVEVERKWAVKVYGLSQLAKYVPGNIFHLAGRQALGMAAGVPALALGKSTVWELALLAVTGLLFGVLALPLVWPSLPVSVAVGSFIVLFFSTIVILRWLSFSSLSVAFCWQLVFLVISGAVFLGALAIIGPTAETLLSLPVWCGAYVIAWLAGLVTPGAPAGVGVREMVLLFLFRSQVVPGDLLFAIVLGRIITVVGDILYFAFSLLIGAYSFSPTRRRSFQCGQTEEK